MILVLFAADRRENDHGRLLRVIEGQVGLVDPALVADEAFQVKDHCAFVAILVAGAPAPGGARVHKGHIDVMPSPLANKVGRGAVAEIDPHPHPPLFGEDAELERSRTAQQDRETALVGGESPNERAVGKPALCDHFSCDPEAAPRE